ncbi:BCCT family transporter [Virgibacillus pantothenticus]|uniref:BCCT family transporter n=1 Tax=Virgibacillus pantothenticus TaxID=1473 RepID=UPI001C22F470|nr:BCCT family transporter [Virgibacillus pantothenticus]MBU8565220.1 BCCT family transporter [Virgibacillus pantothenticus]MBU8601504.1 BCCT family transporter [Virgibacillus pantothenticus]MBU8633539.1 BCCT family transporter [Virgibacillus pantothenticus]MBU8643367.1 BCCT family transporter [Virgibacillus pantothenticus]MBU8647579.1 BCCT family transporter [Virgibacillus pantothenticus]
MKSVTSVFWYSLVICIAVVIWGSVAPIGLESFTAKVTIAVSDYFGWYYLLAVMVILAFCIYLILSRYGNIKLGKEKDEPEFSLPSWFAMLFSAGMGMGLVFWTTAEPISHAFTSTPGAEPGSDEAIRESLKYTFFHWGIHAWAVYGIVALVLAYFKFHKDQPGLISVTLMPIFGEKSMRGLSGKIIDVLSVFATVIGVAATLGFGSAQINGGMAFLFDTPDTFWMQLLILGTATAMFIASSWSGVGRGIKYLSNANMGLAVVLLLMLFIAGPTLDILNMFTHTLGSYVSDFFDMSLRLAPQDENKRTWINNWTIFYWAWWISWAPFVGIFIARISKGRTVKEFMLGVLAVPSIICFIFFAVFGVSALNLEQNGIAKISEFSLETSTFGVLAEYPLGYVMSIITLFVVAIFFITSADSATFVLGMLSTNGTLNPHNSVKIMWGVMQAALAAIIVYFGGTQGLQNMLIIAALPFSIVILLMAASFYKTVRADHGAGK